MRFRAANLALALATAACAPDSPVAPVQRASGTASATAPAAADAADDSAVAVVSRNLYLGSDLAPVLTAQTPAALVAGATEIWATVRATNFPERAGALAGEILTADAALVGLQEVTLYRVQAPSDAQSAQPTPATAVRYDFLAVLLDSLAARGARYRPVATVTNFDAELPAFDAPGQLVDVRLTDRDVILARVDVAVSDAEAGTYQAKVPLQAGGPGGPTFLIPRGFTAVTATASGRTFRFVNTHLEVEAFAPANEAQAAELVARLAGERLPVVLVGDFNSAADGSSTRSYAGLRAAGYVDAWLDAAPSGPGLTCCHPERLDNLLSALTKRIDFVFFRDPRVAPDGGSIRALGAEVVGDEPADRTPSGLWPSDHAGVVATLRVPSREGETGGNAAPTLTALRLDPAAGPYRVGAPACGRYTACVRFSLADPDGAADAPFRTVIDWGDGTVWAPNTVPVATSLLAPHSYAAAGTYVVRVTATDSRGASSTETLTLQVQP